MKYVHWDYEYGGIYTVHSNFVEPEGVELDPIISIPSVRTTDMDTRMQAIVDAIDSAVNTALEIKKRIAE